MSRRKADMYVDAAMDGLAIRPTFSATAGAVCPRSSGRGTLIHRADEDRRVGEKQRSMRRILNPLPVARIAQENGQPPMHLVHCFACRHFFDLCQQLLHLSFVVPLQILLGKLGPCRVGNGFDSDDEKIASPGMKFHGTAVAEQRRFIGLRMHGFIAPDRV